MNRRELLAGLAGAPALHAAPGKPRNVIFILTDDHRYDAMGFLKAQPWLRTPVMDRMAAEGAHFKNAFVTTALCSPSRASILTGVYAHKHRVVDNNTAIPKGTVFFPSHLQKAGYKTSFFGKWHMGGESDAPQPGFDEWVSFRGQGSYLPTKNGLNVNGKRVPQKGYITDEITDYALNWLDRQSKDQPYFMYLSHKAVHAEIEPAPRHKALYKDATFIYPPTIAPSATWPSTVQSGSRTSATPGMASNTPTTPRSTSRLLQTLRRNADGRRRIDRPRPRRPRKRGQLDSTLVIYMGDNGFAFGEHGLIDKRTAYEESMRVPMLARCPELFKGGQTVGGVVAGLDIMPTVLAASGVPAPAGLDGMNFLPLTQGQTAGWRKELLYEYYWERNFQQTPTVHALRGARYKFIRYHGIWDIDELYDLREDPLESRNLIFSEAYQPIIREMRERLFKTLEETGGLSMPLWPDRGGQSGLRNPDASKGADFPPEMVRRPKSK